MQAADLAKTLDRRSDVLVYRDEQMGRVLGTHARKGHAAMVDYLIDHRVPVEVASDGLTPLMLGALSGDPHIARILLAHGAKLDRTGPDGVTALMLSTEHDRAKYAEVLLEAGAKPNLTEPDGYTALHFAATANAAATAARLLSHRAEINARAKTGTPLQIALIAHAAKVAAVLADNGAAIDLKSANATQQLQEAIAYDLAPVLDRALKNGWPADTKFDGWPALAIAQTYHAEHCAELLRRAGAQLDAHAPSCVPAGKLQTRLRLAQAVEPVDPRWQQDQFPESHVLLEAIVDRDGTAHFPRVLSADDLKLAPPAIAALRQWRFTPGSADGSPVPVLIEMPITFTSSEEARFEAWALDTPPVPIKRPAPEYPFDLNARGFTGTVYVRFLVKPDGHTELIHSVKSSSPEFEAAVVKAIARWIFKPGMRDGKPVPAWLEVPIVFTLSN